MLEIYKLVKVNGLRMEIAFLADIEAWIISLDNHSYVMRNSKDLESLHKEK